MSLLNGTNLLHVRVALIYFTRVPDYKRFQLEFILIPEQTANKNTASNKYFILISSVEYVLSKITTVSTKERKIKLDKNVQKGRYKVKT
jgi:hypothetical protein